jgi:hypothetical protein
MFYILLGKGIDAYSLFIVLLLHHGRGVELRHATLLRFHRGAGRRHCHFASGQSLLLKAS